MKREKSGEKKMHKRKWNHSVGNAGKLIGDVTKTARKNVVVIEFQSQSCPVPFTLVFV